MASLDSYCLVPFSVEQTVLYTINKLIGWFQIIQILKDAVDKQTNQNQTVGLVKLDISKVIGYCIDVTEKTIPLVLAKREQKVGIASRGLHQIFLMTPWNPLAWWNLFQEFWCWGMLAVRDSKFLPFHSLYLGGKEPIRGWREGDEGLKKSIDLRETAEDGWLLWHHSMQRTLWRLLAGRVRCGLQRQNLT